MHTPEAPEARPLFWQALDIDASLASGDPTMTGRPRRRSNNGDPPLDPRWQEIKEFAQGLADGKTQALQPIDRYFAVLESLAGDPTLPSDQREDASRISFSRAPACVEPSRISASLRPLGAARNSQPFTSAGWMPWCFSTA